MPISLRGRRKTSSHPVQAHHSAEASKKFTLIDIAIPLIIIFLFTTAFALNYSSLQAAQQVDMNCTLLVPDHPLTATGLATPYRFTATNPAKGPCNESNTAQSAFVQSTIYDPATGKFSVYSPLVIDQGTTPAARTVVPQLPQGAVVAIWFGFNATNLLLSNQNHQVLSQAHCVNGLGSSLFTQYSYCNAVAFWQAVTLGIAQHKVNVPELQKAKDGLPCPTVRDFSVIDQDQSDNVQTKYLATSNGHTAQFSQANQAKLHRATTIANPSDNALLTNFINPALGCQGLTAPNLADNNAPVPSLALDELQASQDQGPPVAYVPLNDPMTVITNSQGKTKQSLVKTNMYRLGVYQPVTDNSSGARSTSYCRTFVRAGIRRLVLDKQFTIHRTSPDPAAANNLYTFLAQRAQASYNNLGCRKLLHRTNPVTTQTNGHGVVISARFKM